MASIGNMTLLPGEEIVDVFDPLGSDIDRASVIDTGMVLTTARLIYMARDASQYLLRVTLLDSVEFLELRYTPKSRWMLVVGILLAIGAAVGGVYSNNLADTSSDAQLYTIWAVAAFQFLAGLTLIWKWYISGNSELAYSSGDDVLSMGANQDMSDIARQFINEFANLRSQRTQSITELSL